jgi:hypothetical protein
VAEPPPWPKGVAEPPPLGPWGWFGHPLGPNSHPVLLLLSFLFFLDLKFKILKINILIKQNGAFWISKQPLKKSDSRDFIVVLNDSGSKFLKEQEQEQEQEKKKKTDRHFKILKD